MIEPPKIVQTTAQPTAMIHIVTPLSEIRNVMMPGLQELMGTLKAQGVTPAGPWLTHHRKKPSDTFDFELSVPVKSPIAPAGRVENSQLPAATVARTVYHGPYEGLPGAWQEFVQWITAQGRKPTTSLWESYVVDPSKSPDPAAWRTELTQPLVD